MAFEKGKMNTHARADTCAFSESSLERRTKSEERRFADTEDFSEWLEGLSRLPTERAIWRAASQLIEQ